jgi:prepilin-type N-terminal cleavage/methylation domain-containing protein
MQKTKGKQGFTIIELSIVLTVIAMIAGTALAFTSSRLHKQKVDLTRARAADILEFVGMFVKQNCHLPCPADAEVSVTDDDFGTISDDGDASDGAFCTSHNEKHNATNVIAGAVPVRHLMIDPTYIIDGWGRKFTYVVDDDLTHPSNYGTNLTGSIEVRPSDSGSAITNNAVVLVMSHGADGHGAWKVKGGATKLNKGITDEDSLENAESGGAFDNIFVQRFTDLDFDDIVLFKMKWHLPLPVSGCP